MANTVPDPVILPDPFTLYPGQPLRATSARYLLGSLNAATAELHAGTAVCQQWEPGVCEHAGATPEDDDEEPIPLAFWRLPVPSDRHTTLRVIVRAERSNADNAATLTVRSVHAADEISAALATAAEDDFTTVGDLTIAVAEGEPWEDVRLYLSTAGGGTIARLYQIIAYYLPIESPMPAQTVSGAIPFGLGAAVDEDRPLPAARGHQIIETVNALHSRPRVVQAWSGLSAEYSGVDASNEAMPEHGVVSMAPVAYASNGRDVPPAGWAFAVVGDDPVRIATSAVSRYPLAAGFNGWFAVIGNDGLTYRGVATVLRFGPQFAAEEAGPRAGLHPGASALRSFSLWGV